MAVVVVHGVIVLPTQTLLLAVLVAVALAQFQLELQAARILAVVQEAVEITAIQAVLVLVLFGMQAHSVELVEL
jgi:hypothetical protein